MVSLQDTIMVDNSRMVAWLDKMNLSTRRIRKLQKDIGIVLTSSYERNMMWFDFQYKNEDFSILSNRDDLILFAVNSQCPDCLFEELINYFQVRASA